MTCALRMQAYKVNLWSSRGIMRGSCMEWQLHVAAHECTEGDQQQLCGCGSRTGAYS